MGFGILFLFLFFFSMKPPRTINFPLYTILAAFLKFSCFVFNHLQVVSGFPCDLFFDPVVLKVCSFIFTHL